MRVGFALVARAASIVHTRRGRELLRQLNSTMYSMFSEMKTAAVRLSFSWGREGEEPKTGQDDNHFDVMDAPSTPA